MKKPLGNRGECCASGRSRGQNPGGLRPLGFWPWDLPRHSIHHNTPSAFRNNVPELLITEQVQSKCHSQLTHQSKQSPGQASITHNTASAIKLSFTVHSPLWFISDDYCNAVQLLIVHYPGHTSSSLLRIIKVSFTTSLTTLLSSLHCRSLFLGAQLRKRTQHTTGNKVLCTAPCNLHFLLFSSHQHFLYNNLATLDSHRRQ